MSALLVAVLVCMVALVLDHLVGEPRRGHPVVIFGHCAVWLERRLNSTGGFGGFPEGCLATLILVLPLVSLAGLIVWLLPAPWSWALEAVGLWLVLSLRGLEEHGVAVAKALEQHDLVKAREQVGRIVSRQTGQLDETGVATAATESMLENGADAVFASLFWYLVAGLPGVVLHRAINTLDAMWGYRNERFLYFGRCAARLDDLLNWLPARLTGLSYAVGRHFVQAVECWRRQAPGWDSPNGGPVMAAGAGALGVSLGGATRYDTGLKHRPVLGRGPLATAATVRAAIRLVRRSVGLWLLVMIAAALAWELALW